MQVARRLSEQLDLDLLPTTGLTILRNDKAVPLASEVSDSEWVRAASVGGLPAATELPAANALPLAGTGERYSGVVRGATGTIVLLSQQFDAAWRLASGLQLPAIRPYRAFGWAVGFPAPAGGAFTVRHGGQQGKRAEVAALAVLWLAALWITRRPVRAR